jgi:hypothetical protein
MMISPQDCLKFAREMDEMARREHDQERHERMVEIANTWREMATETQKPPTRQ